MGGGWDGLGPHLDALGQLLVGFWAFETHLFSSLGPKWALRGLLDRFGLDFDGYGEALGSVWGGFWRIVVPVWERSKWVLAGFHGSWATLSTFGILWDAFRNFGLHFVIFRCILLLFIAAFGCCWVLFATLCCSWLLSVAFCSYFYFWMPCCCFLLLWLLFGLFAVCLA